MTQALNHASVTDDELMQRLQADDVEAFEQLYDRYGALAYRVARVVCRDPHRAEEAVQDGFLSIWRSRANYNPNQGTFKSWSVGIVRNRAIDLNRREASSHRRALAEADRAATLPPSGSAEDAALTRNDADALHASLGQLPDAQAEVITLAFYGELTHAEIAQRLSLPPGTVKGRMRLGLEKLRRQMSA
jgi:RNA polymerase sigma-70 factor (ECF subfamily)